MNKLKISIPQPCHENWTAMTKNEKGRLCESCNKTVVDFSHFSDEDVLKYFLELKKNSNQSICGYIKNKHLALAPKRTFQPLRIAVAGLLLLSTTYLLQSCTSSTGEVSKDQAEGQNPKEETDTNAYEWDDDYILGEVEIDPDFTPNDHPVIEEEALKKPSSKNHALIKNDPEGTLIITDEMTLGEVYIVPPSK